MKRNTERSSLVTKQVKYPALSLQWPEWLLWHRVDAWPRKFHIPQPGQKEKWKKTKQNKTKHRGKTDSAWGVRKYFISFLFFFFFFFFFFALLKSFYCSLAIFFFFFMASLALHGCSLAKDWIWTTAATYATTPDLTHCARPGTKPTSLQQPEQQQSGS